MAKLRVSLNLLPVGPRGNGVLNKPNGVFFALQIVAGYEESVMVTENNIEVLWPWRLYVDGDIGLTAWGIREGNLETLNGEKFSVIGFNKHPKFTSKLREIITGSYRRDFENGLDLRLCFPSEINEMEEEAKKRYLRNSFPARVSYLGALPGELAGRLRATVYFSVPRDVLFRAEGGSLSLIHI